MSDHVCKGLRQMGVEKGLGFSLKKKMYIQCPNSKQTQFFSRSSFRNVLAKLC